METFRGTIQRLGLEGGLWALVTDDGRTLELLDAPEELLHSGARAEVSGDRQGAEVTVGMVGDILEVRSYAWI